jgi:hypothetical protein
MQSLQLAGLSSFPTTRLTTFVDTDNSGSSLDYWLGSSLVDITDIFAGGSTAAQHRPLRATISLTLDQGATQCLLYLLYFKFENSHLANSRESLS